MPLWKAAVLAHDVFLITEHEVRARAEGWAVEWAELPADEADKE